MQDLTNGRINTNNLTTDEWELVNEAYGSDWFVPNDEQWLLMRNLLGLFEIRRGYSVEVDADGEPYLLAGTVNIRLNEHGIAASELLKTAGRFYQSGKPCKHKKQKARGMMSDSQLLGEQAYEKLLQHEAMFTGLCDEIYHTDGYVCFRFGGYTYRLWHYSILNNPISGIYDAVRRSRDYYDHKTGKKDIT